ncbi:MAG: hypothetical protein AB8H80_19935 [Planctomycetota bacterium]
MAVPPAADSPEVERSEESPHDEGAPAANGQRLIVLWLCWIALAAFLIAAGVIGFR